ncbi:MAG: homoserine O-succinyltransferase [Steroidobacteraceae bacterium]
MNSREHTDDPADARRASAVEAREGVLEVPGTLSLHHGGELPGMRLGWRLSGAVDGPIVLALGGISASRRVYGSDAQHNGWWNEIVGPGRALDATRVRILGIDYLGGSGESTRPVSGSAFPSLSSYDQADAILCLLNHLDIKSLRAIVGASYGGMIALAFGERYPERVEQLVVISAADVAHPMATAWRSVQRSIVRFGIAAGQSNAGMELARALAMSTYRSPEEFAARFRSPPRATDGCFTFPVEEYLFARGRDYAARHLPESFVCLSESIDLHRVDATRITVPTQVVAVREDQLVPLADMRALAARLPDAHMHELSSLHGHDAFLKEAEQLKPILSILSGDNASD